MKVDMGKNQVGKWSKSEGQESHRVMHSGKVLEGRKDFQYYARVVKRKGR